MSIFIFIDALLLLNLVEMPIDPKTNGFSPEKSQAR